jgi:hypothetical protein
MRHGIIGTHIATNQPVEIELNEWEVHYVMQSTDGWDTAMEMVEDRTGIRVIGAIDIDWLVLDGIKRVFH